MGPGVVVSDAEVVMILDWQSGKASTENRQVVSYARAHGFLVDAGGSPQSLVVTKDKLFLTPVTAATLWKRLHSNAVTPSSDGVLR